MYLQKKLLNCIFILSFAMLLINGLTGCSSKHLTAYSGIGTHKQFILLQPIVIQPFSTRTFIQNGKLTGRSGFDRYQQHCRIEIKSLSKQPQTVLPQTFKIIQIRLGEEQIATNQTTSLKLYANLSGPQYANSSYEPPETMDLVHFYLESSSQPDILRLTCAGALSNGNPMDAPASYRPNIKNIRRILGGYGKIESL